MLDIFLDSGYLDFNKIMNFAEQRKCNFILIVGARGTGKTYGSLKWATENKLTSMYIRRLKTQAEICATDSGQPFKAINRDTGWHIHPVSINKEMSAFYECDYDQDKKKWLPYGLPVGYLSSLSTFANLNSADFSDVDIMIFDEFIAKPTERMLKDEAGSYFNFYETIARNRELMGKKPLISLCLANSNNLANPLFIALNLVNKMLENRNKGYDYYVDSKRGLLIIDICNSPISVKKKDTALYRLTAGLDYGEMALNNDFVDVDKNNVKQHNLIEYTPLCNVGELYIYQHKSRNEFYITHIRMGGFNECYSTSEYDLKAWVIKWGWSLRNIYLNSNVVDFETYLDKVLFHEYLKI